MTEHTKEPELTERTLTFEDGDEFKWAVASIRACADIKNPDAIPDVIEAAEKLRKLHYGPNKGLVGAWIDNVLNIASEATAALANLKATPSPIDVDATAQAAADEVAKVIDQNLGAQGMNFEVKQERMRELITAVFRYYFADPKLKVKPQRSGKEAV